MFALVARVTFISSSSRVDVLRYSKQGTAGSKAGPTDVLGLNKKSSLACGSVGCRGFLATRNSLISVADSGGITNEGFIFAKVREQPSPASQLLAKLA